MKGARIVVTGGAGFIGSHLVDALMRRGAKVVVLDDLTSGSLDHLAAHRDNPDFRFEYGDVRDEAGLVRIFAGAEYVFHLACRNVRLSLRRPTVVHDVNATGTLNVLKAATAVGVKRLLYTSSSEVNGTADVVPMPEDYHFKPETIYGASKLTGEYYTQVFVRAGLLDAVIARPHNNYGPREHYAGLLGEVIPRFILAALFGESPTVYGDGAQTRDFTYVEETAEYLVRLMLEPKASGGVFNVCRGEEVSVAELARLTAELTGADKPPAHLPGRPSDVLRLFGDPSRLRALLGDSPSIGLREGLARTIDWFREFVPLTESTKASLDPRSWEREPPEPWMAGRL